MLRAALGLRFLSRPTCVSHVAPLACTRPFASLPSEDNNQVAAVWVQDVASAVGPCNVQHVRALLHLLISDHHLAAEPTVATLKAHPAVCQATPAQWAQVMQQLQVAGFQATDVLPMVCSLPSLLETPSAHFPVAMQALHQAGFPLRQLTPLVFRCPQLLQVQPRHLAERVAQLKSIFTRTDVVKLIQRTPTVIFEEWKEIERKLQYILFRMGEDQLAVLHSHALEHSLHHIWVRHECASRAGVYKTPDPKRPLKTKSQPLLRDLTDTTDAVFAGQVVGIAQEEYYTFLNLLEAEDAQPFSRDEEDASSENEID